MIRVPDLNVADGGWSRAWDVPGDAAAIRDAVELVHEQVQAAGWEEAAAFAVRLAMDEALTNALRHGHAGDVTKPIAVVVRITSEAVHLEVTDAGPGFDPAWVPDPTAEENLTIASGRGLALIRAFMTEVQVVPPGNQVRMRLDRA